MFQISSRMTFGKFSAAFSVLVIILSAQTTSATSTASCRHIDAAFRWRSVNRTYFFSGDEAIVFSDYHHAEEDVVPVTSLAPNFPSDIEAAVGWFKKNRSFFFKGCYGYMVRLIISHIEPYFYFNLHEGLSNLTFSVTTHGYLRLSFTTWRVWSSYDWRWVRLAIVCRVGVNVCTVMVFVVDVVFWSYNGGAAS